MVFYSQSESNIVEVSELELLTNVLLPSWIQCDKFGEEMSSHGSFNHVRTMQKMLVMISFHSSACSFNIFTIILENLVQLLIFFWNGFPVVNDSCPINNCTVGQQFWHREYPTMSFPSNICNWILDKSEKVFESSLLVSSIIAFLSESVFFKFPIILFSNRSEL